MKKSEIHEMKQFERDLGRYGPPTLWAYWHGAWVKVPCDRYVKTPESIWFFSRDMRVARVSRLGDAKMRRKPRPDNLPAVPCRVCYSVGGLDLFWPGEN